MTDNKNLILGSIAIIAVVLVALILFFPRNEVEQTTNKLDDIKVLVHHEKTDEKEGYYSECNISTENLVKVRNEYDKAIKLTFDASASGVRINGDYKVMVGEDYVAFDKEHNNKIYISDANMMFNFKSTIYDIVINTCVS